MFVFVVYIEIPSSIDLAQHESGSLICKSNMRSRSNHKRVRMFVKIVEITLDRVTVIMFAK